MKIAIIGSGVAGLAAGRLLKQQGHHTTVFERQSAVGMNAHEFKVPFEETLITGDLPSRMFNAALWPNVLELYRELGVEAELVDASQNFRHEDGDGNFRFSVPMRMGETLGLALRSDYRRWLKEADRLRQQGSADLKAGNVTGSFAQYLGRHHFDAAFCERFLYPALSATVCTCSHAAIDRYPAIILLDALQKISGSNGLWRASLGSGAVVNALLKYVDVIRCNAIVTRVTQTAQSATVQTQKDTSEYDHVIIATQANHAGGLCPEITTTDRAVLDAFEYEDVRVVVHSDRSLMPTDQNDWSVFNFFSAHDNPQRSMCSVWLNRFHRQWPQSIPPLFQTIKPIAEIDPGHIISDTTLQRPIVNDHSWSLWESLERINGSSGRLKFCGSYAVAGIPLLESAVVSAQKVSTAILSAPSI